jgi:hypothetical protein
MNEHTERNPMAIQEEMNKFIEEKPMSERMKEPGRMGFCSTTKSTRLT